jgi:hypothetical protein
MDTVRTNPFFVLLFLFPLQFLYPFLPTFFSEGSGSFVFLDGAGQVSRPDLVELHRTDKKAWRRNLRVLVSNGVANRARRHENATRRSMLTGAEGDLAKPGEGERNQWSRELMI